MPDNTVAIVSFSFVRGGAAKAAMRFSSLAKAFFLVCFIAVLFFLAIFRFKKYA